MKQRTIGNVPVSAIGLGAMPLSIEGRPEERQSTAVIHAALEAGVTLIDTADAYHLAGQDEVGHNEELIGRALRSFGADAASQVIIATKGGHLRPQRGPWAQNGHPSYLKEAAKASARRLGVDVIDLYQFHRPDPLVPYADSIGALADLLEDGIIRMAGISNANVAQIKEANEVLNGRLASVQNQYSPKFRSSESELALCAELGIAFLPWSPLGGISSARDLGSTHEEFACVGQNHGVSSQVVALAWELSKADVVIPLPGASRPGSILDSVSAPVLELTPADLELLDAGSVSRG
ncbi:MULTISPECIES: aldo/keto reductase [Micrococcaceae]|uniref:aldo/keto reductase n=1 Tax=Micrococcaceae TaxID=1268 RepID=UPI0006FE4466|nr:aldo/keto reductase [Arthrobacter sp. Soil761]KRE68929.1 aldo/keto reductase [Arthrobacter sp. Soil761]